MVEVLKLSTREDKTAFFGRAGCFHNRQRVVLLCVRWLWFFALCVQSLLTDWYRKRLLLVLMCWIFFLPRRRLTHRNHFEKREGMKVGGMFKSPMTIIMVFSMVMMFFLPKMMENLDPEQLEVSAFQRPREWTDCWSFGDA